MNILSLVSHLNFIFENFPLTRPQKTYPQHLQFTLKLSIKYFSIWNTGYILWIVGGKILRLLYADLFRLTQFASAKVPLTRLTKMWFWHLDKQISGSGKLCAFNVSFLPKSDATSIHFCLHKRQMTLIGKTHPSKVVQRVG